MICRPTTIVATSHAFSRVHSKRVLSWPRPSRRSLTKRASQVPRLPLPGTSSYVSFPPLSWSELTLQSNRVLRQDALAIPGATKVSRVEENTKLVDLTDAEAAELQEA